MLFNSLQFAVFLPVVFLSYWLFFNKTAKHQNLLLLLASIVFYCWADYRFLFLLLLSALFNFYLGLAIYSAENDKKKKRFLLLGLIFNIGILAYFKYFNFFFESFVGIFNLLGENINFSPVRILLPLGISFFSFQMIGYIIDLYRDEIEPCRNVLTFIVYVAYFPKLLAGPIERAQKFLPQIEIKRNFDSSVITDGLRQMLWGFFAKLVISNNCAIYANNIFDTYQDANGSTLFLGAIFYTFQIYGDFSGYSNIAIGVSKLFGIKLMTNFSTPLFSTNISDFWKKWHISLTSWMMDYVFKPLSFNMRRFKKVGLTISIIITFLLVGLWHGAEWKFILYGLLHGIYFVPLFIMKSSSRSAVVAVGRYIPSFSEALKMLGLFILVSITIVFFRAPTVAIGFDYIYRIFTQNIFTVPQFLSRGMGLLTFILVILFVIAEWVTRQKIHPMYMIENKYNIIYRWAVYYLLVIMIFIFSGGSQPFIYFQF